LDLDCDPVYDLPLQFSSQVMKLQRGGAMYVPKLERSKKQHFCPRRTLKLVSLQSFAALPVSAATKQHRGAE
jgi:hypothetical protein